MKKVFLRARVEILRKGISKSKGAVMKEYRTLRARGLDDEILCEFWEKLTAEGVAQMTFYECMPSSPYDFCLWAKGASQDVRLIEDEFGEILAMYWLNNPLGKSAMIHFCYVRAAFLEQNAIGKYVVRSLLLTTDADGAFVLSALMGITPKVYRHALKFIKDLGFSLFGVLPKSCYFSETKKHRDGVISVLTRENLK